MESSEKFCLRWNDFESNISVAFREIREEKDFFDCTLSVGDRQLQAHKLILSACSPFFRSVLRKNSHPHPLLYLKGVQFSDLQSVLNFMYHGEVNVAQEDLNSFLAVAEDLKVKGLTQNNSSGDNRNTVAKQIHSPIDNPPRPMTIQRIAQSDPPIPKRPGPPPPYPANQQDDDDIQEVMPVVKTEPIVEQQQPSVTSFQQSQSEVQGVGGTLTQMEDQSVCEENDEYDYGGYVEEYEGMEEGTLMGDIGEKDIFFSDTETMDLYIDQNISPPAGGGAGWMCCICGRSAVNRLDIKRHIESKHCSTPGFRCDVQVCNGLILKTRHSLATHKRLKHNIT